MSRSTRLRYQGLRSGLLLAGLLFLAPVVSASGACERIVVAGNPQYPPLLWVDPQDEKRLIGAGVELLEMALADAGITVETLNVGPWARAQDEVRSGRVDMLAGAFLTHARLGYMDYVYPAYIDVPSVIFIKRGNAFPYSGWDDLRGKRGSTLVNNSYGQAFDSYARDHLRIEQVPSIEQSFRAVLLGRVDYVIYERHQGLALAGRMGIADQLDIIDGSLISEPLHYTISHRSACNSPALRSALALAMQDLVSRGEPQRLLEKYQGLWSEQFGAPSGLVDEPAIID